MSVSKTQEKTFLRPSSADERNKTQKEKEKNCCALPIPLPSRCLA